MRSETFLSLWMLLVIFCGGTCAYSQEKEIRTVSDPFTGISVGSGIDLYLTQGVPEQIVVEAEKSILRKIETRVVGGVLKIGIRNNLRWIRSRTIKVYVTMEEITTLFLSGGADLRTTSPLSVTHLTLKSSGGSDAYVSVNAIELDLNASGGANIRIEGSAHSMKAVCSGGADIQARQLKAHKVVAEASGGADLVLFADEELEVSVSGGSDVDYYGNPVKKVIHESSGGDATAKE